MSDPKRQKRGEETRVAVLEATLRLLAREGPRGVTHRAVAKEAGTSVRGITYYFESRERLLADALYHYADVAVGRIDALQVTPEVLQALGDDAVEVAANVLAQTVINDLTVDRDGLVAEYEMVLEVSRNSELEATYQRWQERLESLLGTYARHLGSPCPELDARLVLATIRGLEIEALARPTTPICRDDLVAVFRRLAGGVAR